MDIGTTDELLAELLAHTVVLRARADELTRLLAQRNIAVTDVLAGAARVADRMPEVLRVARALVGEDNDHISPAEAWLLPGAPGD
jgi:hypothetical protein